MTFGIIEILASILIVISVIKIVALIIHPESWFKLTKNIFNKPNVASIIFYILASVVLYFLIRAGITIIEIFAVMMFLSMFIAAGMIKYLPEMIKKYKPKTVLQDNWFYVLAWVALLIWAIIALFL